ncbi:acetyl-CoA carboxylase biotin carboxylase subunit family protein [Streptomyces vinaceus]|uniref:ATP-grasp domain-containing protein n=1 Tax=Streptomyces vinaceus TaxID=1960 RepID=UPI0035DD0B28
MRVLVAGLGEKKEFGLRSLRDAGHFVGVIDLAHRIPVSLVDWWRAGDRFSVESMLAAARSADFTWDAVVCWEELSTDLAREVAERLGVPATRMPAGHFRHKGVMHARLRELGVPTPQLGVAHTLAECAGLIDGRYPAVVKPTDYGGSGGVRIVRGPEELPEAFAFALEAARGGQVAVDRYVSGKEFSVESVTWAPGKTEVITVTEKHLSRPPYFAELGHVVPAVLPQAEREELERAVVQVLDALGMEAGVSHAEFRLTPEGPLLMEVAGRPAGDQVPRLVSLATGWNLYLAELAAVVGSTVSPEVPAAQSAAIRFFNGDGRTPFRHPVGLEDSLAAPFAGVLRELSYSEPEGAVTDAPRGIGGRNGHAVLAGSADEVREALRVLDDGRPIYQGAE